MLTIIHAADFHLDSPFRALPLAEATHRRREQRQGLEALRDLVLERRADLVLLAGDLFDQQQVYPETLEALRRVLGQLPCPVCIAPGNHDYWSDLSPYATLPWPDNVHIFKSESVTPLPFPALGLTVYGCAFTSPARESDPLAGFSAPAGELSIGLMHGEVGTAGCYAPISPDAVAASGLTYLALGHIHQTLGPHRLQRTTWACPGCLQGRGFDETGDKGVLVVELEDALAAVGFAPLPGPRYLALSAAVTGRDPAAVVAELLGSSHKNDYIRLTLTGEADNLDLPALRAMGQDLCRQLEVLDNTALPLDLWRRSEEDTLTGLFLREMKGRLTGCERENQEVLQLALRFGLAALEGREELI